MIPGLEGLATHSSHIQYFLRLGHIPNYTGSRKSFSDVLEDRDTAHCRRNSPGNGTAHATRVLP